ADLIERMEPPLSDVWHALRTFLLALGDTDEVTIKETKIYIAFRRFKNFVCMRPSSTHLVIWTKVDPDSIDLEDGFTRDVREIGHYGTGELEVLLRTMADLEKAKPLFVRAFEDN
ncbi:MAG: DUF5655 domain-containing protein, partial [Deltaproteobacteria bacterium]